MIVLYILILIYFNFNSTSIVNVFMLSIEKTKQKTGFFCMADNKNYTPRFQWSPHDENLLT